MMSIPLIYISIISGFTLVTCKVGSPFDNGTHTHNQDLILELPMLEDLLIKYYYARFWRMTSKIDCTADQLTTLYSKCGMDILTKAISSTNIGMSSSREPFVQSVNTTNKQDDKVSESGLFVERLDELCHVYANFLECADNFGLGQSCLSDQKVLVDMFYSYSCNQDRTDLIAAGQCLTKENDQKININGKPGCEDIFYDMSSTLQITLSVYHAQGESVQDAYAEIKEMLGLICHQWYNYKTCLIPAYADVCSPSAVTAYYNGLIQSMVDDLRNVYHLEDDDLIINNCKAAPVNATKSVKANRKHNTFFGRTALAYFKMYNLARKTLGPCSAVTVMHRSEYCFFHALEDYTFGEVVQMMSHVKNDQMCTSILEPMLDCYEGDVLHSDVNMKACPPENKLNLGQYVQLLCQLVKIATTHVTCMQDIPVLARKLGITKCGLTLSQMVSNYVNRGCNIYSYYVQPCSAGPMPLNTTSVIQSCYKQSLSLLSDHIDLQNSCQTDLMPALKALIDTSDDMFRHVAEFFHHVREITCGSDSA